MRIGDIFLNKNFYATSDWNGDDGAYESENIHTDSDGGEDNESGESRRFGLDSWSDDIAFDLLVDNEVDSEGNSGGEIVDSYHNGGDNATDNCAKNRDKAHNGSKESEWNSKTHWDIEDETKDKDGNSSESTVDEGDDELTIDEVDDDLAHSVNNVTSTNGAFVLAEAGPKFV